MPIDFNDYQTWHAQQRPNGTASTTAAPPGPLASDGSFPDLLNYRMALNSSTDPAEPPAPYPTSFSEIVELITKGDPIPGIKEVPDIILDGQASHATTAKRRKPWENRVSNGVSIPSDTC